MNAGNTQQAIKIFEQSAEMDTTEMKPLNMLVNIYQNELKDMEKLEKFFSNYINEIQKILK